jgi:hypothetical protein
MAASVVCAGPPVNHRALVGAVWRGGLSPTLTEAGNLQGRTPAEPPGRA